MLVSRGESHLLAASEVGLPIVVSSSSQIRAESSVVNGSHFSLQNASELGPDTRSCVHDTPLCLTESKVTFLSLGSLSNNHFGSPNSASSSVARKISSENCSSSNSSSPAINGEAQMSRFMGLARKFNCFYFNGKQVLLSFQIPINLKSFSFFLNR